MIYDPKEHVASIDRAWSAEEARACIAGIVDDAVREGRRSGHWPLHAEDRGDDPLSAESEPGIYLGAAGIIFALDALRRAGHAVGLDLLAVARQTLVGYSGAGREPWYETSYMLGPIGSALAAACLGETAVHEQIADLIERNLADRSYEVFIGVPGSMLAARFMHEKTGDARWKALFMRGFERVWAAWDEVEAGIYLWRQHLYGRDVPSYVGPGHGFAGTVAIVLAALLDDERRAEIHRRAISTAKALAVRDGSLTNWVGIYPETPPRWPLQWCHGAPGVASALCSIPPGLDAIAFRIGRDLPVATVAADSSASHLAKLTWFRPGSARCTQHQTYANGVKTTSSWTELYSRTKSGWITVASQGDPGVTYFGYDAKKRKYVEIGVYGPRDYDAGYDDLTAQHQFVAEPLALYSDPVAPADYYRITPRADGGYTADYSGIDSPKYPRVRYHATIVCVRG